MKALSVELLAGAPADIGAIGAISLMPSSPRPRRNAIASSSLALRIGRSRLALEQLGLQEGLPTAQIAAGARIPPPARLGPPWSLPTRPTCWRAASPRAASTPPTCSRGRAPHRA